ncbi:MAG: hypothetical protein L5656_11225, partial [Thermanaeromonas sp.]|uniref:hypothetical protein n=1 Tax=Thermanaeromonas sp. TaxID=2003697 RepID=UPI0024383014
GRKVALAHAPVKEGSEVFELCVAIPRRTGLAEIAEYGLLQCFIVKRGSITEAGTGLEESFHMGVVFVKGALCRIVGLLEKQELLQGLAQVHCSGAELGDF